MEALTAIVEQQKRRAAAAETLCAVAAEFPDLFEEVAASLRGDPLGNAERRKPAAPKKTGLDHGRGYRTSDTPNRLARLLAERGPTKVSLAAKALKVSEQALRYTAAKQSDRFSIVKGRIALTGPLHDPGRPTGRDKLAQLLEEKGPQTPNQAARKLGYSPDYLRGSHREDPRFEYSGGLIRLKSPPADSQATPSSTAGAKAG
jgi:hypothetical protein